jgi:hypothetical protein
MAGVVVLAPAFPFVEVARAFERAGWTGGPTTALAPLVAGEPEVAVWRRGGSVARYSCDPVVWLRVVRVEGDEPLPDLPLLTTADADLLRRSDDEAERLLGADVARLLGPAG